MPPFNKKEKDPQHPNMDPHVQADPSGSDEFLDKDFFPNTPNSPIHGSIQARSHTNAHSATNGSIQFHEASMDHDAALKEIRTVGSLSISPELFEKIYLSPQNAVKGDLRKTFGNPTPVALAGLLLSITPLSCDLMGWSGAGGNGAASIGAFIYFGGLLMLLGGFLEFILGNTFPFVVFCSYGSFWFALAATLQPQTYAFAAYSSSPGSAPQDGLKTIGFNSSFAFFLLFMGLLSGVYFVCSLRTNLVFVVIFLSLIVAFGCLSMAHFEFEHQYFDTLVITGGAALFVTSLATWYIFSAIMLETLDFPFQIPVGDISMIIKSATLRNKETEHMV